MIIEIRGTGTHNKGAELMLCAIRQFFTSRVPDAGFAVDPRFGTYAERARYGLLTKFVPSRFGRSRAMHLLMSDSFRNTFGIVEETGIDAHLDASGFAFGDQWGPGPSERLASRAAQWKRRSRPLILMPQAFGSFEQPRVRDAFRRAIDELTLVFARDQVSYEHVQQLGGPFDHVFQAPDFTDIVEGVYPAGLELPDRFACVTPNVRMLDRTEPAAAAAYVGFLADAIRALQQRNVVPVWLYHGGARDRAVAAQVEAQLGRPLIAVHEVDPVFLKGIIGKSVTLVGSRFHALVSALSQGVPAIGTSWSHKYEALFSDYDSRDLLATATAGPDQIDMMVGRVCDAGSSDEIRRTLRTASVQIRQRTMDMFEQVSRVLGV